MRTLLIAWLSGLLFSPTTWETDFQKAIQSAQSEHKLILLNFSGSDWCGPCIRMHKEIFESNIFTQYANDHLVLVNADFPRLRKNKLSNEQEKKNEQLADNYNKEGIFPITLLLNADGKVLKKWEGFPKDTPEEFTNQVKEWVDAKK
ncbi:MAG: thioredoxin family protein [Chitinophagaceae bacterium]|nr:thioredoxin family protein [Chitinophagaceae bacterium]